MVVYLSIFGILSILSYKELFGNYSNRAKKYTVLLISVLYIILSSIYRGPMGDFYVYEDEFINTNVSHLTNISENHFEYLYEVLSVFVRLFTSSYAVFRMIVAIIVIFLWYKIYSYNSSNCFNKYIITMLLTVWALTFGNIFIVRSTIAVSICMFSIRYIHSKSPIRFLLCLCFAVGFHTMSIIWLPAYLIYNQKKIRKYIYVLIFASILMSQYLPNIIIELSKMFGATIHNRISVYISYGLDNTFGMSSNRLVTLVKALANIGFLMVIFLMVGYSNHKKQSEQRDSVQRQTNIQIKVFDSAYSLYLVGVLIYIIALFTSLALSRAALPYTALQYILLPQIFECKAFKRRQDKQMIFVLFIAYLLLRMILTIMGSAYVPFINFDRIS